jgi:hypothetical protein
MKMKAVIELEFEADDGFPSQVLDVGLERGRQRLVTSIEHGLLPGVATGIRKGSVKAVIVTKLISIT